MLEIQFVENFKSEDFAFLGTLYLLSERGKIDQAGRYIYRHIDWLLSVGRFDRCAELLNNVNLDALHVDLVVGLLASTYAARHSIPTRFAFAERAKGRIASEVDQERASRILKTLC